MGCHFWGVLVFGFKLILDEGWEGREGSVRHLPRTRAGGSECSMEINSSELVRKVVPRS